MRFTRGLAFVAAFVAPAMVNAQILDVCAAINVDLFALLGLVNLGGIIDVCLCVSLLPVFIETNVVAQLAASLVGVDAVVDVLAEVLAGATGSKHCTYPNHYTPICIASDPCGFNCTDGYTKSGKDCVCLPPKHECNGKCTDAPCPSGKPKAKRELYELENMCPPNEQLCGIWSSTPGHAWECVNTQRNLESCGGCVTPLPGQRASGRDCTAIPGVSSVQCVYGECMVGKCKHGWKVNSAGNGCFSTQPQQEQKVAFLDMDGFVH